LIEVSYKKILNYSPKDMYDIVKDINSYSEFIPGCVVSKIISEENHFSIATLGIKYSVMSGEFTSQVNFDPENLTIFSEGIKGPFRSVFTEWRFVEAHDGAEVQIEIKLDLKNKFFESLLKKSLKKIISQAVSSFEERADLLY
jgi:coenzyme Q-binding protein COQ10|tara:strand:- start:49 stop:477 length:429 start_codon:yes stop_codon:yes gene_type:complete